LQDADDTDSWISIESVVRDGNARSVIKSTQSGTTSEMLDQIHQPYIRVVRAGPQFTIYGHRVDESAWVWLTEFKRVTLGNNLRIGFAVYTLSSDASWTHTWSYFHCDSGGLPACDYTLDGPNGCRAHMNTLNFGGFPSLPYGRIYGI
jgi:hypothetical protein